MSILNEGDHRAAHGVKASMVLTQRDPKNYAPSCDHDDGYLRTLITGSGGKQYKFECQTCGRRGSAVRHDHFLIVSLRSDPPMVDDGIAQRWWDAEAERRKREFAEQKAEKDAAWWSWYDGYLQSAAWKERAAKVLARDHRTCQADLEECERRATQVHHLTYDHVGNEPLFDLIAICGSCHDRLTSMDRERRAA